MLSALLLFAAAPPQYDVAFVARFYYPYPDKRISREEVYVCDITGKHRKQVTNSAAERDAVRWVTPTRLAWAEWSEAGSKLVFFDLQTKKSRVLLRTTSPAGVQRFEWNPLDARPIYLVDGKSALVEPNGTIVWGEGPREPDSVQGVSKWNLNGSEVKHVGWLGEDGKPAEDAPRERDFVTRILSRDGKEVHVVLPSGGYGLDLYAGAGKDTVWAHTSEGGGSAGASETLIQIDWAAGKSKTVLNELYSMMLSRNERYWVALAPWRNLSKYGPSKQVWTKSAYAGDLKTGKRWTIASGVVNVTDIALRPEMQ